MNLVVDQGNTFAKIGIFDRGHLIYKGSLKIELLSEELDTLAVGYKKISHCIYASVGRPDKELLKGLRSEYNTIVLNHDTSIPFTNNYETPSTLGVDRIALIAAAVTNYPGENVLVIDAGSCITYDFVTGSAHYLGGAIAPGISMRYKAMHTFTANLPLLRPNLPVEPIGKSTNDSMHSGVLQAVIFEIEGFIQWYDDNYGDLKIILTGGDAHFLRDSIKSDIFANSNFLLEGLNHILEHNKD